MSKSNDALTALLKNWDGLQSARPTESEFSTFGYPLSYGSMDELFKRWKSTLSVLDEKSYWNTSPEVGIADGPLAAQINELSGLVINASGNGVNWLLSNRFLDVANNIQNQISAITSKQVSLNKEAAKLLIERSTQSLDEIISAAKAAKSVIALEKESESNAQKIANATSAIESANALVESTNARIGELAQESKSSATTVQEKRKSIEQSYAEISELKNSALAREAILASRAEMIDGQLLETESNAKSALKSVEEALRKVRDQGLAHSFQSRSNSLQTERIVWTVSFVLSTGALLWIAILFAVELSSMTYESLLVHLLRKVGLAAPLIWLGWYSARQVGRISRVQEDYEYKAASALAFQSYKDEAKLGGDPEMEKRLLDHAIRTFGENPVRLYDGHANDPVTPLQAAIGQLPPEKIAAIMAAFGDQTIKSRMWESKGK